MISAQALAFYITIFLGIACTFLFFDSIYKALYKRERFGVIGILVIAFFIASILFVLEHAGYISFRVACW
jgi:hypothetical protein